MVECGEVMTMFVIVWEWNAWRDLERLSSEAQARLDDAIVALALNPTPAGVRAVRGRERSLRIRVGSYRVIYQVDYVGETITIRGVGHRSTVYDQ